MIVEACCTTRNAVIGVDWDSQREGWRVAIWLFSSSSRFLIGPAYKRIEPAQGYAHWIRDAWGDLTRLISEASPQPQAVCVETGVRPQVARGA